MSEPIGILISTATYRKLRKGQLNRWRQLAHDYWLPLGLLPVLAPPTQVDLERNRVWGAVPTAAGWRETEIRPLPRVYYNRLLRPPKPDRQALRALNGDPRLLLFNETNRWHRGMIMEMLSTNPALSNNLWPSQPFTSSALQAMEEGSVYLAAPVGGAVRRNGYLLQRQGRYLRYKRVYSRRWSVIREDKAAALSLITPQYWVSRLDHIIGVSGRPVEWRFYLLRTYGLAGGWAFSLAAAVAKFDLWRSRRQRERCWPLQQALARTFNDHADVIMQRLKTCALTVMQTLVGYLPGIAHAAVDFWLDPQGMPRFAYVTGAYRIDWLDRIGDEEGLHRLHRHPPRFAHTLLEKGIDRLDVDFGRTG